MNFMSLRHYRSAGKYYTPTRPESGLIMMLLYSLCVPLQLLNNQAIYQVTMVAFVGVLITGGVLKHLTNTGQDGYASEFARWSAVVINCYGVLISTYSLAMGV